MTVGTNEDALQRAGALLQSGGLVAFPTETVYGLGGDALQADSSRRIYAAKGRPSDNPLIVHIASIEALAPIVKSVPAQAEVLAEAFWPGPLTMIMEKSALVPTETTGGLATVAVRMPDHPIALALIKAGGGYVAAPSANTSGRPSPTKASHVMEDLAGKIDAVIDGGDVGIGLESTIVDLTGEVPVILRPGYISRAMLEDALGCEVKVDPGISGVAENVRPKAPGMKYRHYAPRAAMTLVEGERTSVTAFICEQARRSAQAGQPIGVMCCSENAPHYTEVLGRSDLVRGLGPLTNERAIAAHLYGALRDFDGMDVAEIFSEAFETPQMGQAIMNRLLKAAGGRIVTV